MLLLPYKADVDLGRWPIMTLLVCAICTWVFARQAWSANHYARELNYFCTHQVTRDEQLMARYISHNSDTHLCDILLEIRRAPDPNEAIANLAQQSAPAPFFAKRADSVDYFYNKLRGSYRRFDSAVTNNLTDKLHYDPKHPTLASMITSVFSHGSWWHLISNLIFFFAFAASVEVIAGYWYYAMFIVLAAIGTSLAYSYSVMDSAIAPPTVGLSGVVMAMMAFLATVAPSLSIRCFFWFIIIVRTFRVPALAIAGLYVAENVFEFLDRNPANNINYVAHLSGAAIGVTMGIFYRMRNREYLADLLQGI